MSEATDLKIFISWSQSPSREVAEALREWLPELSDRFDLFVSTGDIDPGIRGLNAIADALSGTKFGLIVVTQENQFRPWLNFEAGALSREVGTDPSARVVPLLVDFPQTASVQGGTPLVQFQYKHLNREDMLEIVKSMAKIAGVDGTRVVKRFNNSWDEFKANVDEALADYEESSETGSTTIKPSEPEMVTEILDGVRELMRRSDATSRLVHPDDVAAAANEFLWSTIRSHLEPGDPTLVGVQRVRSSETDEPRLFLMFDQQVEPPLRKRLTDVIEYAAGVTPSFIYLTAHGKASY